MHRGGRGEPWDSCEDEVDPTAAAAVSKLSEAQGVRAQACLLAAESLVADIRVRSPLQPPDTLLLDLAAQGADIVPRPPPAATALGTAMLPACIAHPRVPVLPARRTASSVDRLSATKERQAKLHMPSQERFSSLASADASRAPTRLRAMRWASRTGSAAPCCGALRTGPT